MGENISKSARPYDAIDQIQELVSPGQAQKTGSTFDDSRGILYFGKYFFAQLLIFLTRDEFLITEGFDFLQAFCHIPRFLGHL